MKKILASLLAVVMLLTVIPLGALPVRAAVENDSNIILGNGDGITRAEWLHNLVYIFDMTVEEESLPDNYFADLDENHEHYDDILLAVEFGVVNIEAGGELLPDNLTTRDFAASTLNFCLGYQLGDEPEYTYSDYALCADPKAAQVALNRSWVLLLDGCFEPTRALTSEEAQIMLDDATAILHDQIVDENYESTYTFVEDAIVIPDGTLVTEDEDGKIRITDCPESILVDDIVAVYFNGIPSVYKAIAVDYEDAITVLTVEALDADNAFVDLDAQGVLNSDAMEIVPAEGVDMTVEEEEASSRSTYGIKRMSRISAKIPLEFGNISGYVSATINNPYVDYSISSGRVYVALCGDTTITYNVTASAGLSKGLTLFTCNIAGIGSFDVTIQVDLSGSANGTVKGRLVAGIEAKKNEGLRAVKSFTQSQCYTNVEAEAKVSLKAYLGVTKMPLISAYIYAEVGTKVNFSKEHYFDGKKPEYCAHFAAYLFAEYGASASVKFGFLSYSESWTYTIYNESNSPVRIVNHYEDGVLVPKCTRENTYSNKIYFTKGDSRWSGSGWIDGVGGYGLNEDGTSYPLYDYVLNGRDGAIITQYNGNSWSVYIPEEIDGHTVVEIGYEAFAYKDVGYVVIPDTITAIDNSAFEYCESLKEVTLSKNLTELGGNVFSGTAIETIDIPKSLDYCGVSLDPLAYGAFSNCENLKTATFEAGTTKIVEYLFAGSTCLETITIPDTVTTIENYAFYGCESLRSISIGNAVTHIGHLAFSGCSSLTDVVIPNNVTEIGASAFADCTELESIVLPERLAEISPETFFCCTALESIVIPNSVTKIDNSAFEYCESLKEVTLSKNLTELGGNVFSGTAIETIDIPKSLDYCGVSLDPLAYGAFSNCENLKTATFEAGTTKIVEYLFAGSNCLETITIPNTVTTIENYAFYGCESLSSISIGNAVTHIGHYAFSGCSSLTGVVIPNSVTEIGASAFADCTELESIVLSERLTEINPQTFLYCTELESIVIPNSVTQIGYSAFEECTALESVTLPDGLTTIADSLFLNCASLKAIDFPKSVTSIQSDAFNGCTSLENFTFSNGSNLTTIENDAFYDCTSLQEAVLPETVEYIGPFSFQNCTALEKVYIPQATKELGYYAFADCESLEDVTIADYSITYLEEAVFMNCSALATITLPKGLVSISYDALTNNPNLVSVAIPESVTEIDEYAFSYPDWMVIYGKPGSYAETFADENGFRFESNYVPAEGLSLVDGVEYIVLDAGDTYRAQFEFYPENANDMVTLTADNDNVTIDGMDIYAYWSGDTVITATTSSGTTYEFTVHVRDISDISIVTPPNKLQYVMGETLDLTGLTLQANYDDGTNHPITDYAVSGFDSSIEGECTIDLQWTNAYGYTYSTTFTVTITDTRPKLTGITIATLPNKVTYLRKESLDLTGLVVMGTYTNGSEQVVTDYTVSGYNALKAGEQTITVTCGEFTATFTVTVENAHTHTYDNACDTDCNGCGAIREVGEHVYDDEYDADCNLCGDIREVPEKPSYIPGDLNGDGRVNNKDLGLLQQYLADWDVTIVQDAADNNNDGRINNKDLGRLQQYLSDWDVTLL